MSDTKLLASGVTKTGTYPAVSFAAGSYLSVTAAMNTTGEYSYAEFDVLDAAGNVIASGEASGNAAPTVINNLRASSASYQLRVNNVLGGVLNVSACVSASPVDGTAFSGDLDGAAGTTGLGEVLNGTLLTNWKNGSLSLVSANAGEAVALDSTVLFEGQPTLKCTLGTVASGLFQAEMTFTTPVVQSYFNTIDIPIFCTKDYGQQIGNFQVIQIWLYTDTGKTLRPQPSITSLSPNGFISIGYARDCTYSGVDTPATTDGEKITKVRVIATSNGLGGSFWLGNITMNKRFKKGSVLIYADGEYESQRDYLLPLLDKYGLKASLALTWKDIGQSGRMSYSDLEAAYQNGHTLINHTYGNIATGWDNNTDWPDSASIANSLKSAWADMRSRGWLRGVGHQVVGYTSGWDAGDPAATKQKVFDGVTGGEVKSLRQGSRLLASSGAGALFDPQPVGGLPFVMMYGGIQVTNTDTATNIQAVIDAAEQRGNVGVILFHRIVANTATPTSLEMKVSEAEAAIKYLAAKVNAGTINCLTVDQL